MTLDDLRIGITDLLTRATLVRPEPDDDKAHAEWTRWVSEYLYQFVIRSRQKGITLEKCHKATVKSTERVIRDEEAARILAYELPKEKDGDGTEDHTAESTQGESTDGAGAVGADPYQSDGLSGDAGGSGHQADEPRPKPDRQDHD